MLDIKYHKLLSNNRILAEQLSLLPEYKILVLSNTIVSPLKEVLEYSLRVKSINAKVRIGNYDNILQDSQNAENPNLVLVFWEIFNMLDNFQIKILSFSEQQINELLEKTKAEIDLLIHSLKDISLVIINRFHNYHFNDSKLQFFSEKLNLFLEKNLPPNFHFVDLSYIFRLLSVKKSIDWQNFYLNKMPYSLDFFKHYAMYLNPHLLSVCGKGKKVLVLDCDNTLWKGILGEDGFNGINMSTTDRQGAIFAEVQSLALELKKQGIILTLCSKNNSEDVDEVLNNHPDMILKNNDITLKKVNWENKALNISNLVKELNLGLDSFVFLDDSEFEINFVKNELPEVSSFLVPKNIFEYPSFFREIMTLFFTGLQTKEDKNRSELYKDQISREKEKLKFNKIDDYLSSLEINIEIFFNNKNHMERIAQMSQKTNQFNLTTIRYTEKNIETFINSKEYDVISVNVKDRFGDNGITALTIIDYREEVPVIDTFLMSCRIIGRNIEYKLLDYLIKYLLSNNYNYLLASYSKTIKNEQVSKLWDKCGFELQSEEGVSKKYLLNLNSYNFFDIKHITSQKAN